MRLFVYGTLEPGGGTAMGDWIAERLVGSRQACAPGRLHGIPAVGAWYPALTRGAGWVRGTLCDLRLRPGDLARLDRYEGREYRRIASPVRTASGRVIAQLYLWRIALPDGAPVIADGDFPGWLRGNRLRAYGLSGT
ncbi:MAG TPA: gamma-glutamylcyclotransferase family protein [Novosphingobium sp.]|nr:gamma-glutamylcyclotransferase family protein [Novosphingobium sp.]